MLEYRFCRQQPKRTESQMVQDCQRPMDCLIKEQYSENGFDVPLSNRIRTWPACQYLT